MIQPTRVLQLAKEKGRQLRHSLEAEKFTCKLEKVLTVYHGYNQLKPKIFPKRMGSMFPSNVVVASEDQHRSFHAGFGSTASIKRHQQDWSDKYDRTRSEFVASPGPVSIRDREASQPDKRKPYGSVSRARKSHTKSPRRVVLRPGESGTGHPADQSSDILCSSVLLTYREGLFFNAKQHQQLQIPPDTSCSDV